MRPRTAEETERLLRYAPFTTTFRTKITYFFGISNNPAAAIHNARFTIILRLSCRRREATVRCIRLHDPYPQYAASEGRSRVAVLRPGWLRTAGAKRRFIRHGNICGFRMACIMNRLDSSTALRFARNDSRAVTLGGAPSGAKSKGLDIAGHSPIEFVKVHAVSTLGIPRLRSG